MVFRVWEGDGELGAAGVEADVAGAVVGLGALGREGDALELLGEAAAVGVVDVDDRGAGARPRTACAWREVVLHVGVEVEVVLGQVGEQRHLEVDRVGAVQRQRVRGDLHRAGPVAALQHPPEGRLQVDRLRRGPLDLLLDPADHLLHRPQQPAGTPAPSRISRTRNAVVVFPLVPVTPTTRSSAVGSPKTAPPAAPSPPAHRRPPPAPHPAPAPARPPAPPPRPRPPAQRTHAHRPSPRARRRTASRAQLSGCHKPAPDSQHGGRRPSAHLGAPALVQSHRRRF